MLTGRDCPRSEFFFISGLRYQTYLIGMQKLMRKVKKKSVVEIFIKDAKENKKNWRRLKCLSCLQLKFLESEK